MSHIRRALNTIKIQLNTTLKFNLYSLFDRDAILKPYPESDLGSIVDHAEALGNPERQSRFPQGPKPPEPDSPSRVACRRSLKYG